MDDEASEPQEGELVSRAPTEEDLVALCRQLNSLGTRLYFVYNRRGAHNDHVARHLARLFTAEVDQKTLVVKHDSECILVPERGARLGNADQAKLIPNGSNRWSSRPISWLV
jgi:hypothetical protein